MDVSALNKVDLIAKLGAQRSEPKADDFEQRLEALMNKTHAEVKEQVGQFVGIAFLKPLFDMMRNEALQSDLFHGGFGESVFSQQLHTVYQDKIMETGRFPLVERLTDRMLEGYEGKLRAKARAEAETMKKVDVHG